MHNALNGNIVCRQILLAKLQCKKSFLQKIIDIYLGNIILVIVILLYPVSHYASVLHDLCSMRDDDFCKMFNKTKLDQLIIDISIN